MTYARMFIAGLVLASIGLIGGIAQATTTLNVLVCYLQKDIVEVIDTHVDESDQAAYELGATKIIEGKCMLTDVDVPDGSNIDNMPIAYRRNGSEWVFVGVTLRNGYTALVQFKWEIEILNLPDGTPV